MDVLALVIVVMLLIAVLASWLVALQIRRRRGGVLGTGRNK